MIKVLMVGPARNVKGGMTSVIDNYYKYKPQNIVSLGYIETINDSNIISKFIKEIKGKIEYKKIINDYDIVHIHMASKRSTFRKIWYIKEARKNDKKVVLHLHGGGFKDFLENDCNAKKRKYIIENLCKCDKIIVLSSYWKEYLSKYIDENKIDVITNGVIIPTNFEKNVENHNILFLGRINKEKGIYDLLQAISKLKKQYTDVKLYIAGCGDNLIPTIKKLKIEDNIVLLGWIDNDLKKEYLFKCSYFCLPSYYEAMPLSLLEAMAYKCISVATLVGSIPEIIKDKENGFLINAGDDIAITNILSELFDNKKERKRISENAYTCILNNYNISKTIQKTINIYKEVLSKK